MLRDQPGENSMGIISVLLISAGAMGVNLQFVAKEPPATEAQVVTLEKLMKVELPPDYRAFLVKEGGGARVQIGAEEDIVFPLKWNGQEWAKRLDVALFRNFYSLDEKSKLAWKAAYQIFIQDRRVPADLLPIAYDAGSNQVLLGISGQRRGKVYYWAKDFEPVDDPPEPGYDNIAFVADSFTDFLKSMRPM
jgi:hypothetical protein